jgi:hypothetical protein
MQSASIIVPSARAPRSGRAAVSVAIFCAFAGSAFSAPVWAHGFAGKRFFPATLATDDPFVADELSLPTVSRRRTGASEESPASVETETSIDFSKRITSKFGVGFGAAWMRQHPEGADAVAGFDNLAANMKYLFYKNDEHETVLSAGVDFDLGRTGAKRVGPESFTTVTPAVFFGRGFGGLPDGMKYLRPFALTGAVGIAIPTQANTSSLDDNGDTVIEQHPHVLNLGLAVQYSVPYLQSFVKDVGLGAPFNRMIPIIEFALDKPLDRGGDGLTGTVNPGILWSGQNLQLGIEAIIPINSRTGGNTGVRAQLHFFLDDLFPHSLGRPLFGSRP